MVKKYGKVFGYFDGTLPNLWTTDADIIKSVFVKDFDHFINRRVIISIIILLELEIYRVIHIELYRHCEIRSENGQLDARSTVERRPLILDARFHFRKD